MLICLIQFLADLSISRTFLFPMLLMKGITDIRSSTLYNLFRY